MRALAAGLTVFLGLGAIGVLATTMAGCSDSTDAGGSGGASGATAAAGAGGASAGTSGGGDAGSTGECAFLSDACNECLAMNCGTEAGACIGDASCGAALNTLQGCVCTADDPTTCQTAFVTDGGDPATALATCFATHCTAACQ